MKKTLLAMAFLALCFPVMAYAYTACEGNLIVNGDFGSGDTGFSSDYSNSASMYDPKTYRVGTNPRDYHSAWASFGDHTTGAGNMLIVNATDATLDPEPYEDRVWEQTVNVSPYTVYTFSYWIALSYPDNPPQLQVKINGTVLGTYDATENGGTGTWVQVTYDWFSGDAESATIAFVDQKPMYHGDDYALDDIELCAQPACAEADLIAGRYMDVGEVSVYSYGGNLYVTYMLDAPWCFTELHLAVAPLSDIPQARGNPIPGKFEYPYYPEGGACQTTPHTFVIPIADVLEGSVIAAHASVQKPICDGWFQYETAWGEGCGFPGKNWAMYFPIPNCLPGEPAAQ